MKAVIELQLTCFEKGSRTSGFTRENCTAPSSCIVINPCDVLLHLALDKNRLTRDREGHVQRFPNG